MDNLTIFLILMFLAVIDLRLFKRISREQYLFVWGKFGWVWVFVIFSSVILITFGQLWQDKLPYLRFISAGYFILTFSSYLLKRRDFFKSLDGQTQLETPDLPGQSVRTSLIIMSDAIGVIFFWIWGLFIFALVLNWFLPYLPSFNSELGEVILTVTFAAIFMLILIYDICQRKLEGFKNIVGLIIDGKSLFKIMVLPILIGLMIAAVSAYMLLTRNFTPSTPMSEILMQAKSSYLIVGFAALAILLAPFYEEVVFRGYFFYVLRKYKGALFAVVVISLAFWGLHIGQYWGDWLAIIVVGCLGLVLTLARLYTGTTVASIILHYAYNAGVTLIPVLVLVFFNPAYFKYHTEQAKLTFEEKERLLKQSIHKMPKFPESYNDLALLYSENSEKLDQALQSIEDGLKFAPQNVNYLDTKAEILYRMRRVKEAIAIQKELVERYPREKEFSDRLKKFKSGEKIDNK